MTLDGSGTDLVNGSDLDNECGGGGLGASLSSQGQKTSRYSFPETQEWSHEVKPQIIIIIILLVFATSTCHVLLCSDIIHLPIKFGIPRWLLLLACTMGDSKVEDFLLKDHPEEATAACGAWPDSVLSQMLQEATQLPVSGIRTKSDFVSLSQFSSTNPRVSAKWQHKIAVPKMITISR